MMYIHSTARMKSTRGQGIDYLDNYGGLVGCTGIDRYHSQFSQRRTDRNWTDRNQTDWNQAPWNQTARLDWTGVTSAEQRLPIMDHGS